MTVAAQTAGGVDRPVDHVTVTIDGIEVSVPKGTLIIRAAELIGIQIPRFCDHPLLEPLGACRQCIVEVEGQRKPVASCTVTVADGMVVKTQLTSRVAEKAQAGTMEMLLINHPLDCPICDKGGECPLQNQAMSNGYAESRFRDVKRTYQKPIAISSQVLLDRERCVLCARCTRFSQQIAGDPFIELFERGALEQVAIYTDEPFSSYFSGNTVQICPVGALTGASYRFRARPFDLVSTPGVCEHCASGCAQRTDHRRGKVMRRLAGEDPQVNEEWNCDKGRWAFTYATQPDRLQGPLVRDADGYLVEASWTEALKRAADGLRQAKSDGGVGVLPGGRLTVEDAYAYSKFARLALQTNDVDFRARPHSREEADFLAACVAGRLLETTYADLDRAPLVLLVDFEPEEESPIVFLRLRKAARRGSTRVISVTPFATPGVTKAFGSVLACVPGTEPAVLGALADPAISAGKAAAYGEPGHAAAELLRRPGSVILVGERAALVPGALSAAARLAEATGAKLGWVPRRAGDRGAVEAGLLPNLLPGGRPLSDAGARASVASAWGVEPPAAPGRDLGEILTALRDGSLTGVVLGGVDVRDLPDPRLALDALEQATFIVSLELRQTVLTERADVVLPVAAAVEKAGTFFDWEGRARAFDETFLGHGRLTDARVLEALAEELDAELGVRDPAIARREMSSLGAWDGKRAPAPTVGAGPAREPSPGEAVLATWHWLLDLGRLQDGEPHLAGTAKAPRCHLSAATAAEIGAPPGGDVTITTELGSVTLPLVVADMPDRVVWVPTLVPGCDVHTDLGAETGAMVRISAWGAA